MRRNWITRLFEPPQDRTVRDAEERWARRNASQPRRCMCGAPGTQVVYGWGQVGSVPPEFWRCDEHAGIPLDAPWAGNGDGTFTPSTLIREYQEGDRWVREFGRDGQVTGRTSQDIRYKGL